MIKPKWFMILRLLLTPKMLSNLKKIGAGIFLGLFLDTFTSGGNFFTI